MEWLYFENTQTGGSTKVPDEPGVKEWHEARGWTLATEPEEPIFVPAPGTDDPEKNTEWVSLYHPAVNARHDFPNNPEAIAGAMESGWTFPIEPEIDSAPAGETPEDAEPEPAPKTSKRRTASATADNEKENG